MSFVTHFCSQWEFLISHDTEFSFSKEIPGLITSRCSGKEPTLLPEGMAGRMRIFFLGLANQITARRF